MINNKGQNGSKKLLVGSIVALLIAISPYFFYLYKGFPNDQQILDTQLLTIETEAYPDLMTAAWYFVGKFIPLYLIILWFFTCKHWWYHVLLIPIAMYSFQLFSILNEDVRLVDEAEIVYIIPIMMIIIPFVYLIRLKLFDKLVYGIDLKKLDEELERLKDVEGLPDDSVDL